MGEKKEDKAKRLNPILIDADMRGRALLAVEVNDAMPLSILCWTAGLHGKLYCGGDGGTIVPSSLSQGHCSRKGDWRHEVPAILKLGGLLRSVMDLGEEGRRERGRKGGCRGLICHFFKSSM